MLKALVTAEGTKRDRSSMRSWRACTVPGWRCRGGGGAGFPPQTGAGAAGACRGYGRRPRYELAHEFLVQQIGTWIADSERELTKVLELIDRAYEAYRATGLLLEPEALGLIVPFQDELVVPAEKQRFLDLSRQTARRRRRGLWLRVAALLLLVGLGVGGFFGVQVYRSNQQLQASNQQLEVEKAEANPTTPGGYNTGTAGTTTTCGPVY